MLDGYIKSQDSHRNGYDHPNYDQGEVEQSQMLENGYDTNAS